MSKKDTIEAEGKIKGLITDGTLTINPKGVNQFEINSYHRFLITTNKLDPIATSEDDRRNLIIRSSDELAPKTKANVEYFNKIHQYLDDKNVIATCYNYFKNLPNLDKFGEIPIPQTEYQANLRLLELSPPELFLKDMVLKYEVFVELTAKEIFKLFLDWQQENNVDYETTPLKLTVKISSLNIDGIEKGSHTRIGNTKKYDIKKIKHHFKLDDDEFTEDIEEVKPIVDVKPISKTTKKKVVNTCLLDIMDE